MTDRFTVACIQNCADTDLHSNMEEATTLVRDARREGADLICLPEYFSCIQPDDRRMLESAFEEAAHPAIPHFSALAKELHSWILLGSLAIKVSAEKVNNRSYLINANGAIVARYNKIHLFDVNLKD